MKKRISTEATKSVRCAIYTRKSTEEPRCGDGIATLRWWLGCDAAEALRWLSSYLGVDGCDHAPVIRPVERRIVIPTQAAAPEQFRLLADVCRRNMRPA